MASNIKHKSGNNTRDELNLITSYFDKSIKSFIRTNPDFNHKRDYAFLYGSKIAGKPKIISSIFRKGHLYEPVELIPINQTVKDDIRYLFKNADKIFEEKVDGHPVGGLIHTPSEYSIIYILKPVDDKHDELLRAYRGIAIQYISGSSKIPYSEIKSNARAKSGMNTPNIPSMKWISSLNLANNEERHSRYINRLLRIAENEPSITEWKPIPSKTVKRNGSNGSNGKSKSSPGRNTQKKSSNR